METNYDCGCGKQTVEKDVGELSTNKGHVYVTNNWGSMLKWLKIRHRRSNSSSKEESVTKYDLANSNDVVYAMDITYETGAASPFDYWYIQFQDSNGSQYDIKDNFYCSISSSDNGNVFLTIYPKSTSELYVSFSKSSGCYVAIRPC